MELQEEHDAMLQPWVHREVLDYEAHVIQVSISEHWAMNSYNQHKDAVTKARNSAGLSYCAASDT